MSKVLDTGHLLKSAGHYYYYPFFHILIIISQTMMSLSEIVFSITSLIVSMAAILCIYLLGKEISNEKTGLIASLLLSISSFHIFGSINYSPMSNGFSLVIIALYIIIKFTKSLQTEYFKAWLVFWITAIFVFFVHPVTSFSLGIMLGGVFIIKHITKDAKGIISPFLAYFIGFIAYLMFVHFSLFREIVEVIFIPEEATPLPAVGLAVPQPTIRYILYLECAVSYLGPTSLVFFGTCGGLKWLERGGPKKMAIILSLILLYSIPLISFFRGGAIQPVRPLLFIEGLMVLPASDGIIYIVNSIVKKWRYPSVCIMFFLLSFASNSSYITWDGNTFFKDEILLPVGFATQSTLAVHPYLMKISTEKSLYLDDRTGLYINNAERGILNLNRDTKGISFQSLKEEGYFVVNIPFLERRMWGRGDRELFFEELQTTHKIYDNGNVQVFGR
jgi:hypothetical protein